MFYVCVYRRLRLQGFDDEKFIFPVGITFAYKQLGNSVVIPAIEESAKVLASFLKQRDMEEPNGY